MSDEQWLLSGSRPVLGWSRLLGEIGAVLSGMGQESGSKGTRAEPHPCYLMDCRLPDSSPLGIFLLLLPWLHTPQGAVSSLWCSKQLPFLTLLHLALPMERHCCRHLQQPVTLAISAIFYFQAVEALQQKGTVWLCSDSFPVHKWSPPSPPSTLMSPG